MATLTSLTTALSTLSTLLPVPPPTSSLYTERNDFTVLQSILAIFTNLPSSVVYTAAPASGPLFSLETKLFAHFTTFLTTLTTRLRTGKRYPLKLLLQTLAKTSQPIPPVAAELVLALAANLTDPKFTSTVLNALSLHTDLRYYTYMAIRDTYADANVAETGVKVIRECGGGVEGDWVKGEEFYGVSKDTLTQSDDEDEPDEQHKTKKQRLNATPKPLRQSAHASILQQLFLNLLRLPNATYAHHRNVLSLLPTHLSTFPNPLYFADPLLNMHTAIAPTNNNALTSILTLTSLFTLITKHSLACPQYYPRLLTLITPTTFNSPHVHKFIPLLTLSLKTTHMPTYMFKAYVKRLARTSLLVHPQSAAFLVKVRHAHTRLHTPRTRHAHATHTPRTRHAHATHTHTPHTRHAHATHTPRTSVNKERRRLQAAPLFTRRVAPTDRPRTR